MPPKAAEPSGAALDLDPLDRLLRFRLLRQRHLEHAVLEVRLDLLLINSVRDADRPRKGTKTALAEMKIFPLFDVLLLLLPFDGECLFLPDVTMPLMNLSRGEVALDTEDPMGSGERLALAQTEVANPLSREATYVTRSPFQGTNNRYPTQSWRDLRLVGTLPFRPV
jgi:hypothetical protein